MVNDAKWNIGERQAGLVRRRSVHHDDTSKAFRPRWNTGVQRSKRSLMPLHIALSSSPDVNPACHHVGMRCGQSDGRAYGVHVTVFPRHNRNRSEGCSLFQPGVELEEFLRFPDIWVPHS